jgi:hypothetical protein
LPFDTYPVAYAVNAGLLLLLLLFQQCHSGATNNRSDNQESRQPPFYKTGKFIATEAV